MSNDSVFADVRRQLGQGRGPGGQRVYSPHARRAAATLALQRQREGHSIASTARSLGVHPVVLGAWMRKLGDDTPAPFLSVAVREPAPTPLSTQPVLVNPASGLRLEGLSIEQIAALLRSLR
jgi:transposase-like protein